MSGEALYNSLKVQRALRNLTQADLATMAGVTRKSVNAIETGRMIPSVLLALKLADVLGVAVDTLFSLRPLAFAPVPPLGSRSGCETAT
jgi:putative transcriptional regulator